MQVRALQRREGARVHDGVVALGPFEGPREGVAFVDAFVVLGGDGGVVAGGIVFVEERGVQGVPDVVLRARRKQEGISELYV